MPDISKCTNDECPLKNKCYRFTCEPSEYQKSYTRFEPKITTTLDVFTETECDYFIENSMMEYTDNNIPKATKRDRDEEIGFDKNKNHE